MFWVGGLTWLKPMRFGIFSRLKGGQVEPQVPKSKLQTFASFNEFKITVFFNGNTVHRRQKRKRKRECSYYVSLSWRADRTEPGGSNRFYSRSVWSKV